MNRINEITNKHPNAIPITGALFLSTGICLKALHIKGVFQKSSFLGKYASLTSTLSSVIGVALFAYSLFQKKENKKKSASLKNKSPTPLAQEKSTSKARSRSASPRRSPSHPISTRIRSTSAEPPTPKRPSSPLPSRESHDLPTHLRRSLSQDTSWTSSTESLNKTPLKETREPSNPTC